MISPSKNTILVLVFNHFDLTWRRCWDRRVTFEGEAYASYAELEDYWFTDNLTLAHTHPDYKFQAECAATVRKFVERHPHRLAELQQLAVAKRFMVLAGGDNIIDTNLVLGESIVRNYLRGLRWVQENLGLTAILAERNDGFGASAQLPQILRGCGVSWVVRFRYSPAHGKYWRGLDGSTVCHATLPIVGYGGGVDKYRPCSSCQGVGCPICQGRGIDPGPRNPHPVLDGNPLPKDASIGVIHLASEELLPNMDAVSWLQEQRQRFDIRFALEEELAPFVAPWLERVDAPPAEDLHPGVELNPNNSGVWVTRIKLKQQCRRQEYALLGAEALCALASWLGAPTPRQLLTRAWHNLLFTMFHDAITGTHVNAAYSEILDRVASVDADIGGLTTQSSQSLCPVPAEEGFSVVNLTGNAASQLVHAELLSGFASVGILDESGDPVDVVDCRTRGDGVRAVTFIARDVPSLGSRHYRVTSDSLLQEQPLATPVIENERYLVTADEHGLCAIFDKRIGASVAVTTGYRPCELVLERDEGSPWATLHPDRARQPLSGSTTLVSATHTAAYQRLVFHVEAPRNSPAGQSVYLTACLTVTLYRGIDRVDCAVEAEWDSHNVRLRVVVPTGEPGQGIYEIPYGMLERPAYSPSFEWTGANGDWPAINWAGVETPAYAVALLNRGLPSYTLEEGRHLMVSLLRSPCVPTYLHEPRQYVMTEYGGMRDAGTHRFAFAVVSYEAPFADSTVVADAESFVAGLLVVPRPVCLSSPFRIESEVVRLTALKWAEEGDALIVRLCEYRGKGGEVVVHLPCGLVSVVRVNLLEQPSEPLDVHDARVALRLRPWEITSLRIERTRSQAEVLKTPFQS